MWRGSGGRGVLGCCTVVHACPEVRRHYRGRCARAVHGWLCVGGGGRLHGGDPTDSRFCTSPFSLGCGAVSSPVIVPVRAVRASAPREPASALRAAARPDSWDVFCMPPTSRERLDKGE
eukprot:2808157-Prymnesium_polylepis.1